MDILDFTIFLWFLAYLYTRAMFYELFIPNNWDEGHRTIYAEIMAILCPVTLPVCMAYMACYLIYSLIIKQSYLIVQLFLQLHNKGTEHND